MKTKLVDLGLLRDIKAGECVKFEDLILGKTCWNDPQENEVLILQIFKKDLSSGDQIKEQHLETTWPNA